MRSRIVRAAAATLVVAAAAACTDSEPSKTYPTRTSSVAQESGSAGTGQPGNVTLTGLESAPSGLVSVMTDLYAGGSVAASSGVADALAGRKAFSGSLAAKVSVGAWKTAQLAVVTAGDDVTLAVTAPGSSGVAASWQVVGGWWPSLGKRTAYLGGAPRFILVAGSDARPGEDVLRSRSDALHVLGVDGGAGGAGIIGIPRDLWVPLSTGGSGKINAALAYGGPTAMLSTVKSASGLPLEGYLLTGFQGYTDAINKLGGLRILVGKAMHGIGTPIDLQAGLQTLAGLQALGYARERKSLPNGDFGRSQHQNDILVAALAQARAQGVLAAPEGLAVIGSVCDTNLTAEQILTFTVAMMQVDPAKVGTGVAEGPFGWAQKQSIVVFGDSARKMFASMADGNLP